MRWTCFHSFSVMSFLSSPVWEKDKAKQSYYFWFIIALLSCSTESMNCLALHSVQRNSSYLVAWNNQDWCLVNQFTSKSIHIQIYSSLIPDLISGTSTSVPWILLFAIRSCPRDHFILMPLRFGTTSRRKLSQCVSLCHPSRWLFIPILCNHCLSHLVLFGPV